MQLKNIARVSELNFSWLDFVTFERPMQDTLQFIWVYDFSLWIIFRPHTSAYAYAYASIKAQLSAYATRFVAALICRNSTGVDNNPNEGEHFAHQMLEFYIPEWV